MTDALRLAVFDCDGTLVDSQHSIVATMQAAWRAVGRDDPPAPAAIRRVVGLPLVEAVARLLPDEAAAEHRRLADAYRAGWPAQREGARHSDPLFPGAREVLDALDAAGVLLGIATGKGRRGLIDTLDLHGLADRFVTLQTSDVAAGKPHPEMLERAMAEAGARPENTAMIGDTVFDILMARNAGVTAIGVSWGYHEVEELHASGALAVIDQFAALPTVLETLAWPSRP